LFLQRVYHKGKSKVYISFDCPCEEVKITPKYENGNTKPDFIVDFPGTDKKEPLIYNIKFVKDKLLYHEGRDGKTKLLDCDGIFNKIKFTNQNEDVLKRLKQRN